MRWVWVEAWLKVKLSQDHKDGPQLKDIHDLSRPRVSHAWCNVITRSKNTPVRTYKLLKKEVGNGTTRGATARLLSGHGAAEPRFSLSELRVRARSSSLLNERLRFAHELNN